MTCLTRITARSSAARVRRRAVVAAAAVLAVAGNLQAADRVTVQRAGSSGTMTLTGEIEDYTARRLTIRLQDADVRRSVAPEEILEIDTHRSEEHQRGREELAKDNHLAAEPLLAAAIEKDVRPWVQQDLLADLVRCAIRRGDRRAAGGYFARMIVQEPSSRHWGVAPLIWATEETGKELRSAAVEWLASSADGVRLLGASILLLDQSHMSEARRALDDLARSPESQLRTLAQSQLWRVRLVAGDVSAPEVQSWRQQVESMPPSIRGGPTYILGRAAAARSDLEQAAADWLWLPLVYSDDAPLAARACVDAADALRRIGQDAEADALYREVIERYAWSPAAGDAKQGLNPPANEGIPDGG